ncbi:transposase [Bacillus pseudomycoides]|uniref:Transposase n=1 Tax=Bacillus pseudomycoides TaxID=64104 RepID=A0AAJ1Z6K8_9BACI|nr:transposase [Bacillus pseudomycoides]
MSGSGVSRKGNPYDNALMESFYKTIKRELIQGAKFKTPEQARKEIFKYIELYYNPKKNAFFFGLSFSYRI